jgi:hypothetical protein
MMPDVYWSSRHGRFVPLSDRFRPAALIDITLDFSATSKPAAKQANGAIHQPYGRTTIRLQLNILRAKIFAEAGSTDGLQTTDKRFRGLGADH